jgi:hypothetical protein
VAALVDGDVDALARQARVRSAPRQVGVDDAALGAAEGADPQVPDRRAGAAAVAAERGNGQAQRVSAGDRGSGEEEDGGEDGRGGW